MFMVTEEILLDAVKTRAEFMDKAGVTPEWLKIAQTLIGSMQDVVDTLEKADVLERFCVCASFLQDIIHTGIHTTCSLETATIDKLQEVFKKEMYSLETGRLDRRVSFDERASQRIIQRAYGVAANSGEIYLPLIFAFGEMVLSGLQVGMILKTMIGETATPEAEEHWADKMLMN
jgi:hypothetical protein